MKKTDMDTNTTRYICSKKIIRIVTNSTPNSTSSISMSIISMISISMISSINRSSR